MNTSDSINNINCEVLIVGGGLAGLTSAMLLANLGVNVNCIEKYPSSSLHPRGKY